MRGIAAAVPRAGRENVALCLVLATFVILGLVYSVATPLFEAPDELDHYRFSRFLATTHTMATLQPPPGQNVAGQEGGQAPLYYMLGALATAWVAGRDQPFTMPPNPHGGPGYPQGLNKNIWLHNVDEDFPYGGDFLAAHLLRLFSVLLGGATVAFTYAAGIALWPMQRPRALLAAAWVAFNPQFLFITASINNDALAAAAGAGLLFGVARIFSGQKRERDLLLLGVLISVALLAKVSLVPLAALALCAVALRQGWSSRTVALRHLVIVTTPALVLAGWWYARNWLLYGDPFATTISALVAGGGKHATTLEEILADLDGLVKSFWGVFGAFNVVADPWLYDLFDALTLLGAIGLMVAALRRHRGVGAADRISLLLAWVLIAFVALLRWRLLVLAFQGRLLFPVLPAIALLLASGMLAYWPARRRWVVTTCLAALPAAVAVAVPWLYLFPAYAAPNAVPAQEVARIEHPVAVSYGNALHLSGYNLPAGRLSPGDNLPVDLYWQAVRVLEKDYSVVVHLLAPDGSVLGQVDTFPATTMFPTSRWPVGSTFRGHYVIPVSPTARNVAVALLDVGVYSWPDVERLAATDENDDAVVDNAAILAKLPLAAPFDEPAVESRTFTDFGPYIALADYRVSTREVRRTGTLAGDLYWRALGPSPTRFTFFVQLIGPQGLVAQYDALAGGVRYPTDRWGSGEVIRDTFRVPISTTVAPGRYDLVLGLYDLSTLRRLPTGTSDHFSAGTVTVTE